MSGTRGWTPAGGPVHCGQGENGCLKMNALKSTATSPFSLLVTRVPWTHSLKVRLMYKNERLFSAHMRSFERMYLSGCGDGAHAQVPPFFGAELCDTDGGMVIKGRGACDTKVGLEIAHLSSPSDPS